MVKEKERKVEHVGGKNRKVNLVSWLFRFDYINVSLEERASTIHPKLYVQRGNSSRRIRAEQECSGAKSI